MHLPSRYQEADEREWRQKEKQARERAAAVNSDLAEAREAQRAATVSASVDIGSVAWSSAHTGACARLVKR